MLPPRIGLIFKSNIINPKLAKIIINWINNKDAMYINNRNGPFYKLNIIYRGSRDGINNRSFRIRCNGRVESLVLIKVKNTNKIFGGYSSIGFSSLGCGYIVEYGYRFYNSSNNFIFSFEDSDDTQNMKISRVVKETQAIMVHKENAFSFGWGSLVMSGNGLYANNSSQSYENKLKTATVYTIEEIEVFTVNRKCEDLIS
ncbi:hypothetical protein RhiirA5_361087 [Rhizophagus irregularis]|uniref:TLDc domain-containing protein n=1 Tax=Rhizophagus irregularis TaxID=588596 RepID=A0A2N0PFP0_9GLOM|nr:hypothetical protein RhiirA5_361087 [Rhizophagus irregularis]